MAPGARAQAVLAGVVLAPALAAGGLQRFAPDLYTRASQEDGVVEWASFFCFAAAAALFGRAAWGKRARPLEATFAASVAALCGFVALEEISWGQRLLGYRPPAYFLERNYQQELNLHNLVASRLRTLALQAVVLGYGVALPLALRVTPLAGPLRRLGAVAPPLGVAPALLVAWALYAGYPWHYTGEWVEWMLGLGFLAGGVALGGAGGLGRRALAWAAAALAAGIATEAALRRPGADPELRTSAQAELTWLASDHAAGRFRTACGLHRRLYSVARESGLERLREGAFATAAPGDRGRYFLDPWSSPYWVRDVCREDGGRRITVYSFGPNRRRDSTRTAAGGDDQEQVLYSWSPRAGASD